MSKPTPRDRTLTAPSTVQPTFPEPQNTQRPPKPSRIDMSPEPVYVPPAPKLPEADRPSYEDRKEKRSPDGVPYEPVKTSDIYGPDSQGYEAPRQSNIQYVSGGDLGSFYNSAGDLIYQVPIGTRLPKGAKITEVTYEKKESGETEAKISYLSLEQQEVLASLESDASKWRSSGFADYAGKYNFPSMPEGAKILDVTEVTTDTGAKTLDVSYRTREQQEQIKNFEVNTPTTNYETTLDQQSNVDTIRLSNIRSAFAPIQSYYREVAKKELEFNALPVETKISELQRFDLMPESLKDLSKLPSGVTISDVTFSGGELQFSFDTSKAEQRLIKAKESEFMSLPPSQRVSEAQRVMPQLFEDISADRQVTDVTYALGEITVFTAPKQTASKDGWSFKVDGEKPTLPFSVPKGEGLGFTVPEGMRISGSQEVTIEPLNLDRTSEAYLTANSWSKPVDYPVQATQYLFEPLEPLPEKQPQSFTDQLLDLNSRFGNIRGVNESIFGVQKGKLSLGVLGTVESLIIGSAQATEAYRQIKPIGPAAFVSEATKTVYPDGIPEPPITVVGGVVDAAFTGNTQQLTYLAENPQYAAGSIIGEVLLSVGLGKIAAPITPTMTQIKGGLSYVGNVAKQNAQRIAVGTVKAADPEVGIYLKSVVLPNLPENYIQQTVTKNLVNPLRYNLAANAVVDASVIARNEVVSVNQKIVGAATSKIAQYTAPVTSKITTSTPYLFTKDVLAPNLKNYTSFISPTARYYAAGIQETYSRSPVKTYVEAALTPVRTNYHALSNIAKYDLLNPIADLALSLKDETVTAFQRTSTVAGRTARTVKYDVLAPTIDNALNAPREIVTLGQRGFDYAAKPSLDYLKAYSSVNYQSYFKPAVIEVKGYSKIAAGKIRYDLNMSVPASKVPHEYSAWDLTGTFKPYPETPIINVKPTSNAAYLLDTPTSKPTSKTPVKTVPITTGINANKTPSQNDYQMSILGYEATQKPQENKKIVNNEPLNKVTYLEQPINIDRTHTPSVLDRVSPFPRTTRRTREDEEQQYYYPQQLDTINRINSSFETYSSTPQATYPIQTTKTDVNSIVKDPVNLDVKSLQSPTNIGGLKESPLTIPFQIPIQNQFPLEILTQQVTQTQRQPVRTKTGTQQFTLHLPKIPFNEDEWKLKKTKREEKKTGKYKSVRKFYPIVSGEDVLSAFTGVRRKNK